MATLTVASNFVLRMNDLTFDYLWDGPELVSNGSVIQIENEPGVFTEYGGSFLYDWATDELVGGDLGSIDHFVNGAAAFWIDGLDVDMGRFLDWADFNDIDAALANMFAGNDQMLGGFGGDYLEGFGGNDVLDGDYGEDVLVGGSGSDTYYVDNAGDVVIESLGNGSDRVVATASYALTLGSSVEFLSAASSAGAITLVGNDFAQTITGNGRANAIDGEGGADRIDGGLGRDVLTGGTGKDSFLFTTAFSRSNVDRITDFYAPQDTFRLDDRIFSSLDRGRLDASEFRIGSTGAQDANDYILYNKSTGVLSYDRDGYGGASAVKFAQVAAGTSLSAADFLVF